MTDLPLDVLDRDGALRETAERAARLPRRSFLAAGAGAFAALALPARSGAALSKTDLDILNYALALEYLQSSFYTEAERRKALRSAPARQAVRVLGSVERAHVKALVDTLGRERIARPFYDFQGTTEDEQAFLKTAVAFEDLAVAAYKGQAYRIGSPAVLAAAISIHSVEARHAAWMRYLAGATPAGDALDEEKSRPEVLRLVQSTKFVVSRPRTRGSGPPGFTG